MISSPNEPALLSGVNSPADLRRLAIETLPDLAEELRRFLIDVVSIRGAHLAAGLGAVELAIALHYTYQTPRDRLIWDGGHQAYPHKILTGRRGGLYTVKQPGGLAPFPCRTENSYDPFGVGHSGTSISAALGMAIAAAMKGESRHVVAVIGDDGLTAGMAFEALNHAGSLTTDLLVILNDNDAPISENVGALSNHIARALSGPLYARLREGGRKTLRQMPTMRELARRSEKHLKGMVLPGTLFEELGFNYIGPVDGHNVQQLVGTLRNLQKLRGPQFLHVVTRKGNGYVPAEADPVTWRDPGPCDAQTGNFLEAKRRPGTCFADVFGQWACDMASIDPQIVCITPAMREGCGLSEFSRRFPDRYFDVAIAEQHAVTFAAGLATQGFKPVVAIHSTFLQRAYDQLIHDVALQKLPVMFAVDRAGMVGGDGATHQGSYDLSYLRCIPGLVIMAPADENECRQMLYTASTLHAPAIVRYPRSPGPGVPLAAGMTVLPVGRAEVRRAGQSGLALLVFGTLLDTSRRVAEQLDATLVNMRFVKPLDRDLLTAMCARHEALVTIEENAVAGGAGSAVGELLKSAGLQIPLLQIGIPDRFIEHGSRETCLGAAGLDLSGLSASIERWWGARRTQPLRLAGGA
jgi:1-deoxy-D-xylulose-5-phosphate synthase